MPHKNYAFRQKTLQASLVTKVFCCQFFYKFPRNYFTKKNKAIGSRLSAKLRPFRKYISPLAKSKVNIELPFRDFHLLPIAHARGFLSLLWSP